MSSPFVVDALARRIKLPVAAEDTQSYRTSLRALHEVIREHDHRLPRPLAGALDALFDIFEVRAEVASPALRRRLDPARRRQVIESVCGLKEVFEREASSLNYELLSACLSLLNRFGIDERAQYRQMLQKVGTAESTSYEQAAGRVASERAVPAALLPVGAAAADRNTPRPSRRDKHGFVLYLSSELLQQARALALEEGHSLQKYLVDLVGAHVAAMNTPAQRKVRVARQQQRIEGA